MKTWCMRECNLSTSPKNLISIGLHKAKTDSKTMLQKTRDEMAFIGAFTASTTATTSSSPRTTRKSSCTSRASLPKVLISRRKLLQHIAVSTVGISSASIRVNMASATEQGGLQIQELVEGSGVSPSTGQKLYMHYTLTLNGFQDQGGKVVDSSRSRGSYFSYAYNTGAVIKGWDQGVSTMKIGGKRRIMVPPQLGYGSDGVPPVIPPNSTLYFEIELARIE